MSFISFNFGSRSPFSLQPCVIVDSEFVSDAFDMGIWEAVVKAYSERNLPVGKNLALATIYLDKNYHAKIGPILMYQDQVCSKYIPNWEQYAKERDEYLQKLLPLI